MLKYRLGIEGKVIEVCVKAGAGTITSGLERMHCPSCGLVDCLYNCDGSQGSEDFDDEVSSRLRWNAVCDAIESVLLAHACAGIDISAPAYLAGIVTALEAAANN